MHKVFISYHHENDQFYKDSLVQMSRQFGIFIDQSVDTGHINDSLPSERIRQIIRDKYLRDSTVTIVLVGLETKRRKHVDWEIYSSMFDGIVNKKSGILVINLPGISDHYFIAPREQEKRILYPDVPAQAWEWVQSRAEYERRYPYMPARIIDNLLKPEAMISVVPWERIVGNPDIIRWLIGVTFQDRDRCLYDLSRPLHHRNSSDHVAQFLNKALNRHRDYWNRKAQLMDLLAKSR
ncbi:MAG: TIR domain-containing protein [Bacteroidetes bacterium]|nr:TIR domain-containing protein [Bacteroidota bacterium]